MSWRNEKTGQDINPLAPPVTAEVFNSSSLPRNTSNIYVKHFNNSSAPSANSPNLYMYPKVNTPVSLAPTEQMSAQPHQMSPFYPMAMMPFNMPQMTQQPQQQQQLPPRQQQQQQIMNSPNIPQLTPLRIQGAACEPTPTPAKKKRGRPPLDGEFEHYTS